MKAKITTVTSGTHESLVEKNSQVEALAEQITRLFSEKHLNYRQAVAVLELVQAEIKECMLYY